MYYSQMVGKISITINFIIVNFYYVSYNNKRLHMRAVIKLV